MKIFLTIFVLLFSSSVMSEDISDFEIEGISIGDSLLDYLSREEIVTEIEINKPAYDYLTDEFGEVYLFRKFEIYNHLSFFVKPNDNHYIIYLIKASLLYDDNIKQCYAKQKEIVEEFSLLFRNTKKVEHTALFPWDPTGKSNMRYIQFIFDSGNAITVSCKEYEKSLKIKNNWIDSLSVEISKKEVEDWFINEVLK